MLSWILEVWVLLGGVGYTIFTIKQKRVGWLCMISYTPIVVYLSYTKNLYANMFLYIYFFISGVLSYIKWGKKTGSPQTPSFASNKMRKIIGGISTVVFVIGYTYFKMYTDHASPFLDMIIICMKVASMIFTSNKNVEGLVLMGAGNFLSCAMFILNGLYTSSIMYIFSFTLNTWGTINWIKTIEKNKK
jgi:nicotinamide mononucleotide transporter